MKRNHLITPARRRARQRGSILVMCLAFAGIGAIGTMAYFSLIQAKSQETEQHQKELVRRTRDANSLALAKEVISRKYIDAPSGPVASETHTLPGGWGEVTIGAFAESPINNVASTRLNKTGAVPSKSFATDIAISLNDGDVNRLWQVQVKSANPFATGDLLVFHEPTVAEADRIKTEKIRVKGRSLIWLGGVKDEIKLTTAKASVVDPAIPNKLELEDLAGNPLKPQNFPFLATTEGTIKGETTAAFDGRISIVDNTDLNTPSYAELITTIGAPPVQLDGLVETLWSTDPVVLNLPDGSAISDDDDDDGGGFEAGGYSADVYEVVRQALDARVRLWMAVRASVATGDKVKYSYQDVKMGVPALSTWYTDDKEFDASDWLGCYADFLSAASQLTSDLTSAMSTLGGPDPNVGAWWPATPDPGVILPPEISPYWVDNNPYPGGWWANAPAGSSGDGKIHINIAKTNHVRINNNTEVLILEGQMDDTAADAAALLDPLMIVLTNAFDTELKLEDIILQGVNKRPVILAMKQEYDPAAVQKAKDEGKGRGNPLDGNGGKDVTAKEIEINFDEDVTPNFPSWRLLVELENCPARIKVDKVGKGATIVGGIRTDASLKGDGGEVTIEGDPDMRADVRLITRRYAWLETFRNDGGAALPTSTDYDPADD